MKLSMIFGATLLVVATVGSGLMHGRLTQRWGPQADLIELAERLESLPLQFGAWKCEDEEELDDAVVEILACNGYVSRSYRNEVTGDLVTVALILGPGGPIAVHTPDLCYSSRDYETIHEAEPVSIGENDSVWGMTFRSRSMNPHFLQVYYGWTTGDHFSAVANVRRELASQRYLYKLQLAVQKQDGSEPTEADAGKRFLADFLPVARTHMSAPPT